MTDWTSRPVAEQILAQSFRSTAEWNAAHWKNPQFDEMLAKFEAEPDVEARSKIGNDIPSLLNDEAPAVIAYFNKNLRASRATVKNLTGSMSNYLALTRVWV